MLGIKRSASIALPTHVSPRVRAKTLPLPRTHKPWSPYDLMPLPTGWTRLTSIEREEWTLDQGLRVLRHKANEQAHRVHEAQWQYWLSSKHEDAIEVELQALRAEIGTLVDGPVTLDQVGT